MQGRKYGESLSKVLLSAWVVANNRWVVNLLNLTHGLADYVVVIQ